jgi:hypothetical protein
MKAPVYRQFLIALILGCVLFILSGCESGATIQIVNQSAFPVYTTIDGNDVTVPGGAEHKIKISTDTKSPFNPDVEEKVTMDLIGETYMMIKDWDTAWDNYGGRYTTTTDLYLEPGTTRKIYIDPNLASIKVINHTDSLISAVHLERHYALQTKVDISLENIPPQQEWFKPVVYSKPGALFYYLVKVVFEHGTEVYYGSEATVLDKDQQFVVNVFPGEDK